MRRQIKFTNKTDWSLREIRSLILKVAHNVVPDKKMPLLVVEVIYRKGGSTGSYVTAWKNSHKVRLSLPRDAVDSLELCTRIAWGLGVCLGKGNGDMKSPLYNPAPGAEKHHPYAKDVQVVKLSGKDKPKAKGAAYYTEQGIKAQELTAAWADLPTSAPDVDIYKDGPAGG